MPEVDPARSQQMRELGRRGAQTKKMQAVERRIRELVDAAPPLSNEERDRLAALLRPTAVSP